MARTDKLLAEWFWTDRWMGSSGFLLPMLARGLYREMLTQAWRRGAKLPNDPESVKRAVGATDAEWTQGWPLVSRFWRITTDNMLVNDTQLEVYAQAVSKQSVRAEAGRLGGLASQAKHRANVEQNTEQTRKSEANGQAKFNPPSPSPSPSPISESVSVSEKRNIEVISHVGDETPQTGVVFTGGAKERAFDDFWRAYPKKRDRKEALKQWNKIRPDAALRLQIQSALELHKHSEQWLEQDGRYVPKAVKWLEDGDWQRPPANGNGTQHTQIGHDNMRAAQAVIAKFGTK